MKLYLIALIGLNAVPAFAQDAKKTYFEFGVGKSNFDVSTKTYSGTVSGVTYTNAKITNDYKDPTTFGFELGQSNFLGTPLRVGIGLATMDIKLKSATGSGTVATGSGTVNFSGTATAAQLRAIGLNYDQNIRVYGVNAYYDFPTSTTFRPYVGFGVGLTDIENAEDREFTYAFHAGLNYDLTKEFYVGAKYTRYMVSGPTDKLRLQYEDISVNYFGVQLGLRF